ncbi:eukaryotic initiation factor, putative [Entamoeba histolytica HM-1:IMSS-B]|uniref:Eukaryotic initiation factor 4E, putative n=6 Tax=Entamoeba histolytica TaxID=5759 RepID=C4M2C3_ENTH1|nr:eukaryotic initiation factor 4E, putative [Entamoeba histolytica HM-1:IMSS]EMD48586.1 eukaryotic initiation factor 4E, putative [Entamoeba histolytica KU27]EMH72178.1 eukaryotic initiation factor, putative [Entamoeba histolytica HM-1:IMSS-B]EMS14649.1 eukaryotic initiation factor 4E, putative [Entamoeba histolytica HM-3:IMSS]ENY60924.1 eukaryotic initiation factor 4E, putative [Entamoeba histolytica HM-1:IMSS-A]GAT95425.1 eukaryotic initiation factor 4e putative [Entamoeba histolytica]|eukprot:XP_650800.1 eukaryotic initiation factor 4E, putative [Entamoeba histolytica HM-1:IMSS]
MSDLHHLSSPWIFWFESGKDSDRSTSITSFGEQIQAICTIENFWGFYEDFPNITSVLKGSDSHFFRDKIRPTQGDDENKNGGRVVFSFDLKTQEQTEHVEQIWCKLLCYCIGEIFNQHEDVNGVSFSMRSQAKITIWLKHNDENNVKTFVDDLRNDFAITNKCKFFDHQKQLAMPIEF